jgi:predicted alpha/beta superfamily hydrolase
VRFLGLVALVAACNGAADGELPVAMATSGAWDEATATVHVHYPDGNGAITLQLSATEDPSPSATAPLPIACVPDGPDQCTATLARFPAHDKLVAFRPQLGGMDARGARYLVERDGTLDVYPHFQAMQGTKRVLFPTFHSTTLDPFEPSNQREIVAYLPASYDENTTARYPVIYFQDGQVMFDDGRHIDKTVDQAWEQTGEFDEFIAIMVSGIATINGVPTGIRNGEYNPTPSSIGPPPLGEQYATMLATELKPQVDAALRTRPEREHTFTTGYSLGASISTWIAFRYPSVFGGYAGLSEATGVDYNWINDQLPLSPLSPRLTRIYLDTGTEVDAQGVIAAFASSYRALGYVDGLELFTYVELGDAHEPYAWGRRFPVAFAYLVPAQRIP